MTIQPETRPASGIAARILRATGATFTSFAGGQIIRLGGNLLLTRLLVPEAFGIMALVTVIVTGLKLFSDFGISQSILRSPKGDDPVFLDTAWTLEVLRGLLLWLAAIALAWPLALLYELPDLIGLIPLTALILVISGFEPTRVDSAARHLQLGRLTLIDLCNQFLGLVITALLAWQMQSVWALALGMVAGSALRLLLIRLWLPGPGNRPRLDRAAMAEIASFGRWLFLATIATFVMSQGDRLILGGILSMERLGLYNIGYFLAAVPLLLGGALTGRLMVPFYRLHPPQESAQNFAYARRLRGGLIIGLIVLTACFALGGPWLVSLLYDPRYHAAGGIVVVLSLALGLQLVGQGYEHLALASGASRQFCVVNVLRGAIFLSLVVLGAWGWGLIGVILGQAIAALASYPLVAALARQHGAWDPRLDAILFALQLPVAATALLLHGQVMSAALPQ